MATTNDIDTKSAVRKFLESRTVVDKEDRTADSADEVQTVLEAVALSFLLYPQAALAFVLRANNVLQQVVTADLQILDYIIKAIGEIDNPDDPITDTSDLTEAQTALVEVDRIGRVANDVRAYDRYTQAINRFLDNKLAKSVKRHNSGELERTVTEAKQDLFRVLSVFAPTHGVLVARLGLLLDGVADFQSVPLTKIVATKTLSKVRSSLNKVLSGIARSELSKTAVAIELLSGAAALSSISNNRQVYDPAVQTGSFPSGQSISASSGAVAASAKGTATAIDLTGVSTPWTVSGTVADGNGGNSSFSFRLPAAGAEGRYYVKAKTGSATYNIDPSNCTLYVEFDGIAPPTAVPVPISKMIRAVTLPTGPAVTLSAILTALNDVTTGLIDGTAVALGNSNRILIYGSSSVTGITIRTRVPGSYDISGNYTESAGSVHDVLGFADEQTSGTLNVFSPAEFVDYLGIYMTEAEASLDSNGAITVETDSTAIGASLTFGGLASRFGFAVTAYKPQPAYLELIDLSDGTAADPDTLGVYIGSIVTLSDFLGESSHNLSAAITAIDGTKLFFADGTLLPRCVASTSVVVKVISPLVSAVQNLLSSLSKYDGVFDNDARDLQRVLSPLLSRPTQAQVSDATTALQAIRTKVNNLLTLLSGTVVPSDRSEFESVAVQVMAALEERGLDRSLELLQACQFTDFFSLTKEEASKGSRFLKASEEVGRNELARTTVEQDLADLSPKGTTPDQNLLPGEELLEDEEQQ